MNCQSRLIALLLLFSSFTNRAAAAEAPNDITCHDRSGMRINTVECFNFLKLQQPLSEIECYNSPRCREEVEERRKAREAHWKQVDQRAEAARERAEEEAGRREAKRVAALKEKCGRDYKNPTIGMPLDRVRQCVTSSLTVAGQINRADGVLTTYVTSGGAFFHVMDGKVIAWGR